MDKHQIDTMNDIFLALHQHKKIERFTRIGIIVNAFQEAAVEGQVTISLVMGPRGIKLKEGRQVVASGQDFEELYKKLKPKEEEKGIET